MMPHHSFSRFPLFNASFFRKKNFFLSPLAVQTDECATGHHDCSACTERCSVALDVGDETEGDRGQHKDDAVELLAKRVRATFSSRQGGRQGGRPDLYLFATQSMSDFHYSCAECENAVLFSIVKEGARPQPRTSLHVFHNFSSMSVQGSAFETFEGMEHQRTRSEETKRSAKRPSAAHRKAEMKRP